MRPSLLGVVAALLSLSCSAQTLSSLLDLARGTEPTYLGAKTSVDVAQARADQAFGALLPPVSATANANRRSHQKPVANTPVAEDEYNSTSFQLTITQPLWRYAGVVGLRQAKAAVSQAEHQLDSTEQELFAKLVSAWLDVLAARDNVQLTIQQEAATRKQWEVALRGLEFATSGLPQTEDARAKYDQVRSDTMAAENEAPAAASASMPAFA